MILILGNHAKDALSLLHPNYTMLVSFRDVGKGECYYYCTVLCLEEI